MLMNIVKNIIVIFENQNQHQLTNINGVTLNNNNNSGQFNNNIASLKEMLNENLTLNQQQRTLSSTNDENDILTAKR
jgi:hypothetical protein